MSNPFRSRRKMDDGALLRFIEEYWEEHGYSPSQREMADALGGRSTFAVRYRLDKLEREGKILRAKGIQRGVRVVASEPAD